MILKGGGTARRNRTHRQHCQDEARRIARLPLGGGSGGATGAQGLRAAAEREQANRRECGSLLSAFANSRGSEFVLRSEFVHSEKKWICVETFFWYYSVPPKPRAAHWKPESKPSHFALSQLQLGKARVHANSFARCIHIGLRFCRSKSKILRRVTKLWLAQNGKYSGL